MFVTGYHGTTKNNANKIVKENRFKISNNKDEWLGKGIYFYEKYSDAVKWETKDKHHSDAVLHVIVEIDDNEYIDFDSDKGKELFARMMGIIKSQNVEIRSNSAQINQCSTMNYIWENVPEVQAVFASFPTEPSIYPVMLQYRSLRREFCVRNNDVIKDIVLLKEVTKHV